MSRILILFAVLTVFGEIADAQTAALVPIRHPAVAGGYRLDDTSRKLSPRAVQSVGPATTWAFKTRESAVLSSPIVRLEDIIEPLDRQLAAWSRLKRVSVALLPSDGTTMRIQRERLAKTITTLEATPRDIDWYGPEEISVRYDAVLARSIAVASYKQSFAEETPVAVEPTAYVVDAAATTPIAPPILDRATRERVRNWIELAIQRELRDTEASFEIRLENDDESFAKLAAANSLASIEIIGEPQAGSVNLRAIGRHHEGAIEAIVPLTLTPHRQVVVANLNLQRGERINASDVRMAPLTAKLWKDSYATSIDMVIGKEVRGIVREGAAVSLGDIGQPILVRRGDLIEIRVVGGSVVITTNAKSVGEGAAGDLVEIETIQPRKRLIAKVVSPGLVEILTRAPQVKE